MNDELTKAFDETRAERDRLLELVDRLEEIATRVGGFMSPADQASIRAARAELARARRRPPLVRGEWTDRVPLVAPDTLADQSDRSPKDCTVALYIAPGCDLSRDLAELELRTIFDSSATQKQAIGLGLAYLQSQGFAATATRWSFSVAVTFAVSNRKPEPVTNGSHR